MYNANMWKEKEGPCLRNFDEDFTRSSINGALALRPQIEKIIDDI